MRSPSILAVVVVASVATVVALAIASPVSSPPSTVEGTVRDAAGMPVPGVGIIREGYRDGTGGVPWWTTDVDGRFRVDGLPGGDVVLRVMPGDRDIRSGEVVRTRAGVRDLALVVDPGPQVLLRIAGYAAPEGRTGHARLVWHEGDGRRVTRYAPIRSDGWTRFVRVAADRDLDLWAVAAPGRPVHRTGLRASREEVHVEPVVGREIRGRVLVSAGDTPSNVALEAYAYWKDAHGTFRVGRSAVASDGRFVVSDLPEGTYRLEAAFRSGKISMPVTATVATGTTDVTLDLRR